MAKGQAIEFKLAQVGRGMGVACLDTVIEKPAAGSNKSMYPRRHHGRVRGRLTPAGQVMEPPGFPVQIPLTRFGQCLEEIVDIVAGQRVIIKRAGQRLVKVEGRSTGKAQPTGAGIEPRLREAFLDPVMEQDYLRIRQRSPILDITRSGLEGGTAVKEVVRFGVLDFADPQHLVHRLPLGCKLRIPGSRRTAAIDEE